MPDLLKRNKYRIKKLQNGGAPGDPKKPEGWETSEYSFLPSWNALTSLASNLSNLPSNVYNWKKNLSDNLNPYSYRDPVKRLYDTIVLNKKSVPREALDATLDKYGPTANRSAITERIDLVNMTLGEDQEYGTISESSYKPTKATNPDAVYYQSPSTEKSIKKRLLLSSIGSTGRFGTFMTSPDKSMQTYAGGVLGEYKVSKGQDEKGHYISYYDEWDLNPLTKGDTGWKRDLSDKIQSIIGVKTNELYGRVYYDPETGLPIEGIEQKSPPSSDLRKIMLQIFKKTLKKKNNGGKVRLLKK